MNKPFQILLAEDDEGDRLLFAEAFSELKIETTLRTVNNGIELMELLHTKGIHLPHLLFLDLNMPRKNGMECLKEIKSDERLKDISVAIYSTSSNKKDIEETFHNGANIYITKPDDFNTLKQLLLKAVAAAHLYESNSFNKEIFVLKV